MRKRGVLLLPVLLILATVAPARADIIFNVLPPDVSGPPGSTVGWGYSIFNDTGTDALFNGIDSSLFFSTNGLPDASTFDFPFVAAGSTVSAIYDPLAPFPGLFQFTWDSSVPVGTTETGTFTLYYDILDADFNFIGTDFVTASYSATVTAPVPEPGTILLLGSGLAALAGFRRKRAR